MGEPMFISVRFRRAAKQPTETVYVPEPYVSPGTEMSWGPFDSIRPALEPVLGPILGPLFGD